MSVNPFDRSLLLQPPVINASPLRYSSTDAATRFGGLNRTVGWFSDFVPWVPIKGGRFLVLGHDATSNGRSADFYDNVGAGSGTPPITPGEPYDIADTGPATYELTFAQIAAQVEMRDYSDDVLSHAFDQSEFQKDAARHAVRSIWEAAAISGNFGTSPPPGQLSGLRKLVDDGHGTVVTASATGADALDDFDTAMSQVVTHNRRVDLIVMNQDAWRQVVRLERNKGYRSDHRYCDQVGGSVLYYNDVPVCLSDHIASTAAEKSSVFFMSLGQPNGVFAIVDENFREVVVKETHGENDPFARAQAEFYSALVSTTDDALAELKVWPA